LFKKKKDINQDAAESPLQGVGGMLTTEEILKKVRTLEIKSKKITTDLFTGEYHSAFKGKGMSFREVREYYAGDDVRFIDWNVSARFSHPFTKVFEEERELTLMLVIDISASNLFGTVAKQKRDLITEIAAVLTFSAINNNDKVGVIFFSNKIEKYIAPKKGRKHALYIVRELLTLTPEKNGTNLDEAMADVLRRTVKPVFLVVNKVDNSDRLLEATEFYSLGFDNIFFVSSMICFSNC